MKHQISFKKLFNVYSHRPLLHNANKKFSSASFCATDPKELKSQYDVVIIGSGHNGLVAAGYLAKAGLSVCICERRHVIGGAAVTEEIVPGFRFSRASYVLSLLRPFIISDLKLKDFGLKFHMREPYSSYTPIRESLWGNFPAKSLFLSSQAKLNEEQISQFSKQDAIQFSSYEHRMGRFVNAIVPLLDSRPPSLEKNLIANLKSMRPLWKSIKALGLQNLPEFHELLTASAAKILDRWFESEPLKATLATDALIGTLKGPYSEGTGYVLLHHIMGGVDGTPGAWAYAEGGMGAVTVAMANSAKELGVHIFTDMPVSEILHKKSTSEESTAIGVVTENGTDIFAKNAVFSNATPHMTFGNLFQISEAYSIFGAEFMNSIHSIDYSSPVTKINVALKQLPNFTANPGSGVGYAHMCTIHLNCESIQSLQNSYEDCAKGGIPSKRPMIEMVIPSSLDETIVDKRGTHVALLFTQYTPYGDENCDSDFKEKYANSVFDVVEEYAPGFKDSIVGKEVLTPKELENTFGLTGGNIFHGGMTMDQLYWLRPIRAKNCWFPSTPMKNLYLCGSGIHPGGGVMGLPGYLAAQALMENQ